MRRSALLLCSVSLLLFSGTQIARAQAVESATARQFTISAGGMASGFQSDDANDYLIGAGTYVDFHFTHWVQLEGEARWLRFNQYYGEHEDNYLIGPRVPIWRLGRRTEIYGKALIGYGKMTFPYGYGYGTFTALAFGGSLDYEATRKLTIRAIDFEYQDWPVWLNNSSLQPYGVSVGASYRVF
ncbi:MAG TPA: outer membrane beta-barrel protein [Terracidiphilus sp.]|nr:outer membrane beta-barrel protein [Terracidiphilus sp.]